MAIESSINWAVVFSSVIFITFIVFLVIKYWKERYKTPEIQAEAIVKSIKSTVAGSPGFNRQKGQSGIMTNMGVLQLYEVSFLINDDTIRLIASEKEIRDLYISAKGKLRYRGNRMIKFDRIS